MKLLLQALAACTTTALIAPHPRIKPLKITKTTTQQLTPFENAITVNTALAAFGIGTRQKSLTPSGLAHAWALGVILLSSFVGWRGYSLCVLYLVAGSAATKVKQAEKGAAGIGEGAAPPRPNVWGSAATGAACALLGQAYPAQRPLLAVAYVASLARSSRTRARGDRQGLRQDLLPVDDPEARAPGHERAPCPSRARSRASREPRHRGSTRRPWASWRPAMVPVAAVAAFVATTCESWLGATLQGGIFTNEVINFINNAIGARRRRGTFARPLL
ncbi:phytol kinase [Aureococcus anophagefferens]|uniref:Phytol kinase n=1 Tax=Aureococcus anophagefferens TaxID=44056 RepID=A0ABR1FPI0_AURAN